MLGGHITVLYYARGIIPYPPTTTTKTHLAYILYYSKGKIALFLASILRGQIFDLRHFTP
jgi:hypothetical protein